MAHPPIALRRRTTIALEAADALTACAVARENVRRGSVSVLGRENVGRAYRRAVIRISDMVEHQSNS